MQQRSSPSPIALQGHTPAELADKYNNTEIQEVLCGAAPNSLTFKHLVPWTRQSEEDRETLPRDLCPSLKYGESGRSLQVQIFLQSQLWRQQKSLLVSPRARATLDRRRQYRVLHSHCRKKRPTAPTLTLTLTLTLRAFLLGRSLLAQRLASLRASPSISGRGCSMGAWLWRQFLPLRRCLLRSAADPLPLPLPLLPLQSRRVTME